MKTLMYSVFDIVAEVFNKPFSHINDGSAVRDFTQAMRENPNKNDFTLYRIGSFNDANGELSFCKPLKIISGFDLKTPDSLVNGDDSETPTLLKQQAI